MNKVNVELSGITRNSDDGVSKDGACHELINMRVANGSLEPVGRPVLEKSFTQGIEPVYVHKNGTYEHVISKFNNSIIFDSVRNKDGSYTNKNITICSVTGVKQICSIGNTLVVVSDEGMYYAVWKDGGYKYLGERPTLPYVHLQYEHKGVQESEDISLTLRDSKTSSTGSVTVKLTSDTLKQSFEGQYYVFLNKLYDDGYMPLPVVARVALRLFDGNYIMHSPLILLGGGKAGYVTTKIVKLESDVESPDSGLTRNMIYKLGKTVGKLAYTFGINSLLDWQDVVSSVDIFISRPIHVNDMKLGLEGFTVSTPENGPVAVSSNPAIKSDRALIEEAKNVQSFYLAKSFPVASGSPQSGSGYLSMSSDDIDDLEQKESLPDDEFTHNSISGELLAYNGMLHVANIRQKIGNPYPANIFAQDSDASVNMGCEVHLKTESGIKIVHSTSSFDSYGVTPYLSYPDSRAFKMVLYTTSQTAHGSFWKEFSLSPHPFLNLAYSLETFMPYNFSEDFNKGTYSTRQGDNIEVSPNKLRVSAVDNPFFFPAARTYTVGNREIIGMASATVSLSAGQAGWLPLYVFTADGVYAMSVGDGNVVYDRSYPVSRLCCTNKYTIASLDNAVAFAASGGIFILQGSQTTKISDKIEGFLPSCIDSSPIIKKIAGIASLTSSFSTTEFTYYLEGARVGYCFEDEEIIVSNPQFNYTYVYNVKSGEWHKMSASIDRFINSYPECFAAFKEGGMYNMYNPHRTVNNVLIVTRPIKFRTTEHKRVLQTALRGIVKPANSLLYYRGESVKYKDNEVGLFSNCGFYVLGSNDAEHFVLVGAKEKMEDLRDFITKMNKSKAYKYFMVAVVGGVRTDVALNYLEFIVDTTFENRLR